MNDSGARIVIVGGGVIGLGVAYHLAKLGADDVLLIERNQLSSGTSWHAAGIVGPLRASLSATRLAIVADEVFPALERETAQSTGYRRTGGFRLARTVDRLVELRRIAAVGEMAGLDARAPRKRFAKTWLICKASTGAARWLGRGSNGGSTT